MSVAPDVPYDFRVAIQVILHEISSRDELDESVATALTVLRNSIQADFAYLTLTSKYHEYTEPFKADGIGLDAIPRLAVTGTSITAWVIEHKTAYVWPGGEIDERRVSYPEPHDGVKSQLFAPLAYSETVVGVLSVGSFAVDHFPEDIRSFLVTLAQEIAILIMNKRYFSASMRLSGLLFDAMDEESIAKEVMLAACEILDAPNASVWLRDRNEPDRLHLAAENLVRPPAKLETVASIAGLTWQALAGHSACRTDYLVRPGPRHFPASRGTPSK
jgi:GAF domain-containing protein